MSDIAIRVSGLNKSYGRLKAVDNLDLQIKTGSVHGFLGPNGAGKTTVIKILLGLVMPNSGEIEIFSLNPLKKRFEIMKQVGAVVEAPVFFEYLTAAENLFYLSSLSGKIKKSAIDDVLEKVGLSEVARKKVGTFSYGMKQRLGIAQALLPKNKLIFLDEPTNGLDPHGIMGVRKLVRKLCAEMGITVFVSSHLLTEVEQICDYVTIIDRGVKICEESVDELINQNKQIELKTRSIEEFSQYAVENPLEVIKRDSEDGASIFLFPGDESDIPEITRKLVANSVDVLKIGMHEKSLEEIFVELTGKTEKNSFSDRF